MGLQMAYMATLKNWAEGEGNLTGNKNENTESERIRKKSMRKGR
jgi:hypothetical protein